MKVKSYIKKMFYYLRNVCIIFYSSKTISNKWWAGLIKQLPLMSKHRLQLLHIHGITPEQVALVSHVEDARLLLHENFTWWEEAGERELCGPLILSEKSVCKWFSVGQISKYLWYLKPPDRMSSYIVKYLLLRSKQWCTEQQKPINK